MVFPPNPIPPVDHPSVDDTDVFPADVPFDIKQSRLTTRRHRWFDYRPLTGQTAASTGCGAGTNNIPAGDLMRVQFDHKPDFISISISGRTATTGRCLVYMGDEGGAYILAGPHAEISIPGPQSGIVAIRNIGTTATYGTIVAIAGYTDPGMKIVAGD